MTEPAWTIIEGDSWELLPAYADASVDHVITDPPYESDAHTNQRRAKRGSVCVVEGLPFPPITEEVRESVACHMTRAALRWALVFCQVEASHKWAKAMRHHDYVRTCVWIKPDGQPQYTGDRPGMGYESIVVTHAPGKKRWNGGGRVGVFRHCKNEGGGHKSLHPTAKPVSLMIELVGLFTDPGELVLDPFCGSGTTGVACLATGRRFVGIEKNPEYADLARRRLTAFEMDTDVRSADAGQLPLLGDDR